MINYKGRAQCLVERGGKILMVQHRQGNNTWWCSPGGAIEPGETPEQAALRELREECNVTGTIIKQVCESANAYGDDRFYTFYVDIGDQQPALGHDPEADKRHCLTAIRWMALNELAEQDRACLFASGLLGIPRFLDEWLSWSREISYPHLR